MPVHYWLTCCRSGERMGEQCTPIYVATPTMHLKKDIRNCLSFLSFKNVIMWDNSTSLAANKRQLLTLCDHVRQQYIHLWLQTQQQFYFMWSCETTLHHWMQTKQALSLYVIMWDNSNYWMEKRRPLTLWSCETTVHYWWQTTEGL